MIVQCFGLFGLSRNMRLTRFSNEPLSRPSYLAIKSEHISSSLADNFLKFLWCQGCSLNELKTANLFILIQYQISTVMSRLVSRRGSGNA